MNKKANALILIIPATEDGKGGGHLVRCCKLVNELRALGREARLFITPQTKDLTPLYKAAGFNPAWCITNAELGIKLNELKETVDFIILDKFQTPADELSHWKKIARSQGNRCAVIGIDEGGVCRDDFDFLIDILPNLEKIEPNINIYSKILSQRHCFPSGSGGTKDTEKRKGGTEETEGTEKIKVLISFGLEDSAGLGEKVFKVLASNNDGKMEITFLNKENFIPNLSERLHEYDLVFTHYGLTAFECLHAGTQVVLLNPTPYHEKLSRKAGFKTIKNPASSLRVLRTFVPQCEMLNKKDLCELLNTFAPHVNRRCPVCETTSPARSLARFNDRTYRRCKKCGIIFMDRLTPAPIEYEQKYFFEQYKRQYGRTYLEDFPNLIAMSKRRLAVIKGLGGDEGLGTGDWGLGVRRQFVKPSRSDYEQLPLVPSPQSPVPSLLDIGCAYGPFLVAAKEAGFVPYGIDPTEEAVKYVNETLGIKATHGYFPCPLSLVPCPLPVITLWYTIEHFQDCISVFKEINNLLPPNGILAFSTPSFSGISGRKNLRKFLSESPADHYTIWSPTMCKKALAFAGFKVKKTVNTGHHPERFPVLGRIAKSKLNPIRRLLLAISKIFGLGDTFEVYAVKSQT